jgi:membrane fusion protein (multidrug efflux system)
MKKERIRKIAIGVAIALGVFLLYYCFFLAGYESTDDAFLESHVVAISPYTAGHVKTVSVADNQNVKAGDVLVELDAADLVLIRDHAKADLDAAEAESKRITSDVGRYAKLIARKEVSEQQYAAAQTEEKKALALVAQKKASLTQANLNLSYAHIVAPSDGRVTRKSVEPGAYVQMGQPLLALVSPEVWVVANFKENQIEGMVPGAKATVEVEALDRKFAAHVESLQAGSGARFSLFPPENATGNFVKVVQRVPVKLVFDDDVRGLKTLGPGLSAVVKVKIP